MKKALLLLCVSALFASQLSAQTCERDSSILMTDEIVLPAPYSDSNQVIGTNPICIGEPYTQSVTFNVPATFTYQGITLPISNVSLATTGAVTGLPAGLNYSCDPPNCVFPSLTLGCMLVSGTATSANAPGTVEVGINLTVGTAFGPVPLTFPGSLAPDQHYYFVVKPTGECSSGTADLSGQISSVKSAPNPFGQQTTISVDMLTSGTYQFEVFNLVGRRVYQESVSLTTGMNQFTFDAGEMPNGTYFYSIGSREGRVSRTFVIQR